MSWNPASLREEIENPYQILDELFQFGHLAQLRTELWEVFKAIVIGNHFKTYTWRERSDLVMFYEHPEKLIEAVYIIHRTKKNKPGPNRVKI